MKTTKTPLWQMEQALRALDKEIAELQERRIKLLTNLTRRKEEEAKISP